MLLVTFSIMEVLNTYILQKLFERKIDVWIDCQFCEHETTYENCIPFLHAQINRTVAHDKSITFLQLHADKCAETINALEFPC